ncbi:MAG: hypothetical protein MESAZ_00579 [Saezia sanguinis]
MIETEKLCFTPFQRMMQAGFSPICCLWLFQVMGYKLNSQTGYAFNLSGAQIFRACVVIKTLPRLQTVCFAV